MPIMSTGDGVGPLPSYLQKPQSGFAGWGTGKASGSVNAAPKVKKPPVKTTAPKVTPQVIKQSYRSPAPKPPVREKPGVIRGSAPKPAAPKPAAIPRGAPLSTVARPIIPTPAAPVAPTQDQWLAGDTDYLSQLRDIQNSLSGADAAFDMGQTDINNDQTSMLADLQRTRSQGLDSMLNDFAGRGLANSSLYTDAQQQFGQQQDSQQASIMDAIANRLAEATTQKQQVYTTADQAKASALQEAIKRYQATLGV